MWSVLATTAFEGWWSSLPLDVRTAIAHDIEVLRRIGPSLGRPQADVIHGSRHANLKELRTRHRRRQWRVLFAFDPNRQGVLLIGGAKTSDRRAFSALIAEAERLFDDHLASLGDASETPPPEHQPDRQP